MAFPRKLLNDHEEVILDLRPHWMFFVEPIFVMVGLLAATVVVFAIFDSGGLRSALGWILGVGFVVWLLWTLHRIVTWNSINFVVTTDRVIYRSGVLSKSGIQIPLERINNVNFHQRIYERLFGAGDLLIESAGTSGQSRFSDVNHPDHVQNVIYKAMEGNENKGWQQVATAAAQVADAANGQPRCLRGPGAHRARRPSRSRLHLGRGVRAPEGEAAGQPPAAPGGAAAPAAGALSPPLAACGWSASSPLSPRPCSPGGSSPVACTRFCEQPDLPHVGGTKDPDVAAIVNLAADLVVMDDEENRREDAEASSEPAPGST